MRRAVLILAALIVLLHPSAALAQDFVYVGRMESCAIGRIPSPCSTLWVMNPLTGRLFARSFNAGTRGLAPVSGTKVYADSGGILNAVDMSTGTLTAVTLPSGAKVGEVVASPDLTRVYVSDPSAAAVYVVRALDDQVLQTIPVGGGANTMAVTQNGAFLAVVNRLAATVSIVNTATFVVERTMAVDADPLGVAWSRDASRLYVASQGAKTVATFDASSGALVNSVSTAAVPTYLALAAGGSRLVVAFAAISRGAGDVSGGATSYTSFITSTGAGVLDTSTSTLTIVPGLSGVGDPPLTLRDDSTVIVPSQSVGQPGGLVFLDAASGAVQKTIDVAVRQKVDAGLESSTGFSAVRLALPALPTCLFEITAGIQPFSPAGGSGSVSIPAPAGCAWSVTSKPPFVSLLPASGTGPGTISFDVDPLAAGTLKGRTADIVVNNQPVTVSQTVSQMFIDDPKPLGTVGRRFMVRGWATDSDGVAPWTPFFTPTPRSGIGRLRLFATPLPETGAAPVLIADSACPFAPTVRCDENWASASMTWGSEFTRADYSFNIGTLPPGSYRLTVMAHRNVWDDDLVRTVDVTVGGAALLGYLDNPVDGTASTSFTFDGWAIDPGTVSVFSGIDYIHVWAFPLSGSPIFLGLPTLRLNRPDIASIFGSQFASAGFHLDAVWLPPGTYSVVAYPHSYLTGLFAPTNVVTVTVLPPVSNPAMSLDGPMNNSSPAQPFLAGGWAVDLGAPAGVGVDAIHVWAFPVGGGSPMFVAAGTGGGSRPDVGAVFGSRFTNSGYTFTISNLPPGVYDLGVYVRSMVTNTFNQSRVVRITIK